MKQLSICLTYFNRKKQLLNTLQSIQNQKGAKELTEIIIVDDVSTVPLQLRDFHDFDLDLKLLTIQTHHKWWVNPCVAFNAAFNFIHSDRVLIQNAECLHATNIVAYTIDKLKPNEYIAMSALHLTQAASAAINRATKPTDIKTEGAAWYCHSKHRPQAFNFCAAIHTSDLKKVGGFDSRFSEGIYYDDKMLLYALAKNNITVRIEDRELVYHQWHEQVWKNRADFQNRTRKNKQLLRKHK